MTRLRIVFISLLAVVVLTSVAAMLRSDPPSIKLPRAPGVAYRTSVTTYSDGEGLVCQPFKIDISFGNQPETGRTILSADQADDVVVAQTPSILYVFYSDLALTYFGTSRSDGRDAKPLLCDVNMPFCAAEKKRLVSSGTKIVRICGRLRN